MQLLGGDADLGTEPELFTVGEAGRRVDHHRSCVDTLGKPLSGSHIGGDNGLGMSGAVFVDVGDRLIDTVHHRDCDLHRQILPAQVGLVRVEIHCHAGVLERIDQPRHGLVGDRGVDQKRLCGVAHAGATGLGVQQDPFGHIQIGGVVDVDMTVADTGLDGRHMCVADHRIDQSRAPAWDHHIDQSARLDQVSDGGAVRRRHELDGIGGQVLVGERCAEHTDQHLVGIDRRCASAQQRSVTGLERQTEGIDGDVGPALIHDPDHAERNSLLAQREPVRQGIAAQHLADRIG